MKHMDVLYGIENPLFKDLKRDTSFHFQKTSSLVAPFPVYHRKNKPDAGSRWRIT
jgi:hypothetical protein